MAVIAPRKGPLTHIRQVIRVINSLIVDINAGFFTGAPDTLAGYDGLGDSCDVTVGAGLNLTGCVLSTDNTDDVHSGVYFIPSGDTITILINKQMINKGGLNVEGDLIVNGQLFLEA